MKPNIYAVIADKATVTKGFLREYLDYQIDEIEQAETAEEFEEAVSYASTSIDMLIWNLTKAKNAINRLNRNEYE